MDLDGRRALLHTLPVELIDQIVSYLSPEDVGRLSCLCRVIHTSCMNESLWRSFVQSNVPTSIPPPSRGTYKDLFLSHYPHWFLTKHRIWFADDLYTGKLLLVRYDQFRGCIEGYLITAKRGPHERNFMDWDKSIVEYNTFNPEVHLDLNRPILRLDPQNPRHFSFTPQTDMDMSASNSEGIHVVFMHSKTLPQEAANHPSTNIWPPRTLPSPGNQRTRAESLNNFRSKDHIPTSPTQVSDATFRIRKWIQYISMPRSALHMIAQRQNPEMISTFGTLESASYIPTAEKPWQGIWCGDYNAHGPEFMVVTQPDDPQPLPSNARQAFDVWPGTVPEDGDIVVLNFDDDGDDDDNDYDYNDNEFHATDSAMSNGTTNRHGLADKSPPQIPDAAPYTGRIEAIKLTGDPNIPRGEYTFIAEDIGVHGLLGHTHQPIFNQEIKGHPSSPGCIQRAGGRTVGGVEYVSKLPNRIVEGARVVKSVGHIALDGFESDTYIPSELILVSENCLAHYWREFRHVSFYKRVDIDALIAHGT